MVLRLPVWPTGYTARTCMGWVRPASRTAMAVDTARLPPVTIINAQIDPLREDGALLEAALKKAGVKVKRTVYSGVTHEFFGMAAVVKKAADAQKMGGKALRDSFKTSARK